MMELIGKSSVVFVDVEYIGDGALLWEGLIYTLV